MHTLFECFQPHIKVSHSAMGVGSAPAMPSGTLPPALSFTTVSGPCDLISLTHTTFTHFQLHLKPSHLVWAFSTQSQHSSVMFEPAPPYLHIYHCGGSLPQVAHTHRCSRPSCLVWPISELCQRLLNTGTLVIKCQLT